MSHRPGRPDVATRIRRNLGSLGRCRTCIWISGLGCGLGIGIAALSQVTSAAAPAAVGGVLAGLFGTMLILHLAGIVTRSASRRMKDGRRMVCLTFPLSEEEQRLVAEVGRPEAEVSLREDFARRFSVTPACIISDGEALFALRRQDGRRVMARFGA